MLMSWMIVPEEGFKLLSEAFLIAAIHTCYGIAKALSANNKIVEGGEKVLTSTVSRSIRCIEQH